MKSLSSRFSYGAWRTLSMLPLRLMYLLSDAAYYLLYYIVRYRRKVVRRNLCKSFPEKDMKEIVKIEKRFFHTFCDSMVEMVKIMSMDENDVKKHLRFEGTELVEKALKEQAGEDPLRREGYRDGTWVLLDYGCMVVHIFSQEAREFYALERLWKDGKPMDLSDVLIAE